LKTSQHKSQTVHALQELQKLMAAAVMRPLTDNDSMQRKWIDGRAAKRVAESFVKPSERQTSFERLEIYNRQYWFRLRKCFFTDYPGLRAVLGDRKFARLTDCYLAQNPSRSFTLRNLGSHLAQFLEKNPGLTGARRQLALDMARLEWAYIQAFDNEARPSLDIERLAGLDSTKIRLALQPHLILLKLEHEIADALIGIKRNAGLRGEASNAMTQDHPLKWRTAAPRLKHKMNFVAVHRFQNNVYFKPLEHGQFVVLSAIQSGATLEKACAKLANLGISVDLSETIKNWFSEWAALEWFCAVNVEALNLKNAPLRGWWRKNR
jgi:hypothetical protein